MRSRTARVRSSAKRRGGQPWARLLVLAGVVAGLAFSCTRLPAQRPAERPSVSPSPPAAASPQPSEAASWEDVDPQAAALRAKVLEALPEGARWRPEGAQERREGALRWRHVRYRVVLPTGANVKATTGALVEAAEQASGVLLASRPKGAGQVLEIGLEHQVRVLPVLQVQLVPSRAESSAQARVAVVLDDAGMRLEELERALRVGRPLSLAILPGLPSSEELARRAREAGLEVLLHLPMEPEDPELASRMGKLAVRVGMGEEDIARTVRAALRSVPGAVGVNNHMGSRATADPRVVRAVLRVVREEDLFFLDSRTTSKSSAEAVAKELGVPALRRAVFLDHDPSPEAVRAQVRRLVQEALREGSAVGIGHANRPHTAEILAEMAPEVERAGVRWVFASELARSQSSRRP